MGMEYEQATGEFYIDGKFLAKGYAGNGAHANDTASEHLEDLGPLPRGRYRMTYIGQHPKMGPIVTRLTPMSGTEMFGRDKMLIHGDNKDLNRTGSSGCIVLPRPARERIRDEIARGNDVLRVK